MNEIDKVKDYSNQQMGFSEKLSDFFVFFGYIFWSTRLIFIIQIPKYAKFQGLFGSIYIVFVCKKFGQETKGVYLVVEKSAQSTLDYKIFKVGYFF